MPTLQLIITDAGRQAIVDAQNTGTLPIVLDQFALGTGTWSPDATAVALQAEIKRIDAVGGLAVADDTIHVTCTDDSTDAYALGEFGLYTDGGVLFGIYSDLSGISDKAADALLLLAADVVLTSVPPGSVTVNGIGFSNPPATESAPGIAEIATQAETDAGTDDARFVTPKKLIAASTSAATANKLMRRDAFGRAKIAAPSAGDDIARKDTVDNAIAGLLDTAPGTLDTLNELAAALGDDPNFATTMTNALAGKLDKAGGTLTGPFMLEFNGTKYQISIGVDGRLFFLPYDDGEWQFSREFGYDPVPNRWYASTVFSAPGFKNGNAPEVAEFRTIGQTDLGWKKLYTVSCGTTLYSGASFAIDVIDASSNTGGSTSSVKRLRYFASAVYSLSALGNVDAGEVSGPETNYVRVVRINAGVYEVQVRQPLNYRHVLFRAQLVSSNDTEITYHNTISGPGVGSGGTNYYYAETLHSDYLTNPLANGVPVSTEGHTHTVTDADIADGSITQPKMLNAVAGTTYLWTHNEATLASLSGSTAYATSDAWTVLLNGSVTVQFTHWCYNNISETDSYARVRKNGVVLMTYTTTNLTPVTRTLNVDVAPGDVIDIQWAAKRGDAGESLIKDRKLFTGNICGLPAENYYTYGQ